MSAVDAVVFCLHHYRAAPARAPAPTSGTSGAEGLSPGHPRNGLCFTTFGKERFSPALGAGICSLGGAMENASLGFGLEREKS